MKNHSLIGSARSVLRHLPLAISLGSVLLASQGCSFFEHGWHATKEATTDVAKAVWPASDHSGESVSLEYQWQLMTADIRQKVGKKLSDGTANIDDPGYAGRAACMLFNPAEIRFDTGEDTDGAGPVARLDVGGFQVQQVGTLETNRQCSPGPGIVPGHITIYTDKRLVVGQIVGGRAVVEVGDRVFDSAGLYFRFRANTLDVQTRIVTGQFEFMAQNQQNPDIRETLFVANATFAAKL